MANSSALNDHMAGWTDNHRLEICVNAGLGIGTLDSSHHVQWLRDLSILVTISSHVMTTHRYRVLFNELMYRGVASFGP